MRKESGAEVVYRIADLLCAISLPLTTFFRSQHIFEGLASQVKLDTIKKATGFSHSAIVIYTNQFRDF